MRPDPQEFLPLKDLVFRILVLLAEGERHGWSLVQALDDAPRGPRLLPGHLYRTLDRMLDEGLIEERDRSPHARRVPGTRGVPPTRFFRLTTLGREVGRAETRRLEALVQQARAGKLLGDRP